MDSKTLNAKIKELDGDDRFTVKGLEDSGKVIPYIGWFWRNVDFTRAISLGYTTEGEEEWDAPDFVGFMENNKWGYPEVTCTLEQTENVERLLILAVEKPSNQTLQAVFGYIQTLRPK